MYNIEINFHFLPIIKKSPKKPKRTVILPDLFSWFRQDGRKVEIAFDIWPPLTDLIKTKFRIVLFVKSLISVFLFATLTN